MLPIATSLLAALLGHSCPTLSPNDPPPCAASNVPGCLPGYRLVHDTSGRPFYVCTSGVISAVQPLSQPLASTPSRSEVVATPAEVDSRGHVGLVLTPGVTSFPAHNGFDKAEEALQLALEFRGSEGGGRVRLTGEWASIGKIAEVSFKYVFLEEVFFRPWLAIGLGVASVNPDRDARASGSGSVGLDLYVSRDFFLTGELKGRVFTKGTEGPAHGLHISHHKQLSFFGGMGFYFF